MLNLRRNYVFLILRVLLLMLIYSLMRLLFFAFNRTGFDISISQLPYVFLQGLRFDISAIVYTNVFFLLLHVLPGRWKYHKAVQLTSFGMFLILNGLFVLVNMADVGYFQFTSKRSTWDLVDMTVGSPEFFGLIPAFVVDYWYLLLLSAGLLALMVFMYPGRKFRFARAAFSWKILVMEVFLTVFVLGLGVLGARGGLQYRPISMMTGAGIAGAGQGPLVTNTTFTILQTLNRKGLKPVSYFDAEELRNAFSPVQKAGGFQTVGSEASPNVVIIILEGFSAEYSALLSGREQGFTPFLDSLMQEAMFFTRAYANGKKSMEALPAILSSIPALMDNPYITSPYNANNIYSLPQVLQRHGYLTWFFHGGANGTMGFDNFCKAAGVQYYRGLNEYPNGRADFDGRWGIFDEPYLEYVAGELEKINGPFMAGIFTLSSHHPYVIPEKFKGRFPEGPLPILEAVAYADYALARFFEMASRSPWYSNTLFVLTADHTAQNFTAEYSGNQANYLVPLLFFKPDNDNLRGVHNHVVQHADIFPSILQYLQIAEPIVAYGSPVFGRENGWAVTYIGGVYQLITDTLLIQFDGERLIGVYDPVSDFTLKNNLLEQSNPVEALNFLKAIIQDYTIRMTENKLTALD